MRLAYFPLVLAALCLGCTNGTGGADCTTDPSLPECGGGDSSRVEGRVTDADGPQPRSFGGEGTVSAASTVTASAIAPGGSLQLLAEAEVQADGSYSLDVPPNQDKLIVQALDGGGEVVAAAILERSGGSGETVTCTPMDTESSLEAAVLVDMVARGATVAEANAIDLRSRITAELAVAVRVAAATGADTSDEVRALAEAVIAAQRTEVEAYAQAGVSVTQAQLFEAELTASQALSSALHEGADGESAHADFLAELDAAAQSQGVESEGRGRAEGCAGMSFRATVEARVDAEASGAILEAALLSAASLEARAQAEATAAILSAGSASAAALSAGTDAGSSLRSDIRTSADAAAAAAAYAAFAAELRGDADVSSSVLGSYLEVGLTTQTTAQAAVDASATAAATLDAALMAALEASLRTTGEIDTRALAEDVVAAYSVYFDSVEAGTATLAAASGDAGARTAASLLIVADGSFRLGG